MLLSTFAARTQPLPEVTARGSLNRHVSATLPSAAAAVVAPTAVSVPAVAAVSPAVAVAVFPALVGAAGVRRPTRPVTRGSLLGRRGRSPVPSIAAEGRGGGDDRPARLWRPGKHLLVQNWTFFHYEPLQSKDFGFRSWSCPKGAPEPMSKICEDFISGNHSHNLAPHRG